MRCDLAAGGSGLACVFGCVSQAPSDSSPLFSIQAENDWLESMRLAPPQPGLIWYLRGLVPLPLEAVRDGRR